MNKLLIHDAKSRSQTALIQMQIQRQLNGFSMAVDDSTKNDLSIRARSLLVALNRANLLMDQQISKMFYCFPLRKGKRRREEGSDKKMLSAFDAR